MALATKTSPERTRPDRHSPPPHASSSVAAYSSAWASCSTQLVQRKANCACGGGCPRCRENHPLRAKLEVSQPGDALEQEADRVAEQVLRMPQPEHPDDPEAHESTGLRLSRYASGSSAKSSSEVPPIVHNVVRSPGEPLDPATRAFMEPRFGQDFSSVRVHSGAAAEQSAREVSALAYTLGHDIVFAPGHYTPHTPAGRHLLAHELTHVMQQEATGVPALQRKAGIGAAAEPAQATPVWLQLYPWLEKLPNHREVIARLDKIHANRHRIQALYRQLDRVGDSFFSEDVERATGLREQIGALQSANIELGIRLPIDVIALLHEDVFPSAAAGKADIGRMALVQDLKRRKGYIEIEDANGLTADPDRIAVYLNPGWDVRVDPDGIHYKTLLQNESLNLLVVQTAIMEEYLRTYDEFVEQNPWVKVELAKRHLAEAKERALEPPPESEEEREIKEYLADRKRYAVDIEQAYVEAGALPVAILSLFVIDGPVDLLLTVVPVGKLGKAGKLGKKLVGLVKDRRKAKLAAKEVAEFLDNLDKEAYVFLRLAERLPNAQRAAVKVLHAQGASGQLIKNLMLKVARDGTADLRWIAEMLESGKIDVKFIERFTLYEAHPRWDILQKVISKSGKVLPEERGQLAKVLKGFLGEESAIKLLKSAGREILETGYQYGGKKSIDVVAATKRHKFVFAEVKNWGEGSWAIGRARDDVIEQLREHNNGIRKFLAESSAGAGDVERKLLMVEKDGFMQLDSVARAQFRKQVEDLGWEIETIASAKIESVAEFIDRLR